MPTSRLLLFALLTGLGSGCVHVKTVPLPGEPAEASRVAALAQQEPTPARLRFVSDVAVRTYEIDREEEGSPHDLYIIQIGEALHTSLATLTPLASRSSPGGPELTLRLTTLGADCVIADTATVILSGRIVAEGPEGILFETPLRGSGTGDPHRVLLKGVERRVEEAFTRARAGFERGFLAAIGRALSLAKDWASEPPDASHEDVMPSEEPFVAEPEPSAPPRSSQPTPSAPLPPSPPSQRPLGRSSLAQIDGLVAVGDLRGALDAASALIREQPTLPEAFQRRAAIRSALGRVDSAMADCYRALELNPRSAATLVTRARIFLLRNDRDRARADCAQAASLPREEATDEALRGLQAQLDR